MTTAKTMLLVLAASASTLAFGQTPARRIIFNGHELTPVQAQRLQVVELYYGVRLPDRSYWYDNFSGAIGFWKGPAIGALPPGLELGGKMPADCSGGGTGVFVNGRELHPLDLVSLQKLGPVAQGRYWVDSNGFFGVEGGQAAGNLLVLARAAEQRGTTAQRRVYSAGELAGVFGNPAGYCTNSGCAYSNR